MVYVTLANIELKACFITHTPMLPLLRYAYIVNTMRMPLLRFKGDHASTIMTFYKRINGIHIVFSTKLSEIPTFQIFIGLMIITYGVSLN